MKKQFSLNSWIRNGSALLLFFLCFSSSSAAITDITSNGNTVVLTSNGNSSTVWCGYKDNFSTILGAAAGNPKTADASIFGAEYVPPLNDGQYQIREWKDGTGYTGCNNAGYSDELIFEWDGGLIPPELCWSGNTRICEYTPEEGSTLASTTVDFFLEAYVSSDDIGSFKRVQITLHNINQNFLGYLLPDVFDSNDIFLLNDTQVPSGNFTFSDTRELDPGNYRIEACIGRSFAGFYNNLPSFLGGLDCTSHQFIVVDSTFVGNISQNSFNQLNGILASTSATSTLALAGTCNPISSSISTAFLNTDFSPISCLSFLFIPDSYYLQQSIQNFKDNVSTHFPLGYVTDFYYIVSTTTASSLTVLDAVVPPGIPGAGTEISLDLTNVLDFVLNATSSSFISGDATSTETFYEITSVYWDWFIYISALFYILIRIVGKAIIPTNLMKKQ